MQPEEVARRLTALGQTCALKISRNRLRFVAYLLVALASASLVSRLLGDSFDVSRQRLKGEPNPRLARQAEAQKQQPQQQVGVDPFATRPRIETKNGHLILQASQDKNIDFKTSGSRGTITLNGLKLDHLLGVARAVDKSANQLTRLQTAPGEGGQNSSSAERYELILRSLLGSADKIKDMRERVDQLRAEWAAQSGETRKLRKQLTKRTSRLNQLQRDFDRVLKKLKQDNCRDEESGKQLCMNGATCLNQYDTYKCLCPAEFEGERCQLDVDECQRFRGTDLGCQNGAKCVNLPGGYKCECPAQFHGVHCTEQHNDCSLASSRAMCGHGKCVNLARTQANEPSFECICDQGWTTDGKSPACLVDVNECQHGNQSVEAQAAGAYPCSQSPLVECINLPGSFQCGPCPAGFQGNGRVCRDIDECKRDNGGCSRSPLVECYNIPGGRICGDCPSGYQSPDGGLTCLRVSACQSEPNGGCDPMAKCVELAGAANQEAARICMCQFPFAGHGVGPNGCTLFGLAQSTSPLESGSSPLQAAANQNGSVPQLDQEPVERDFLLTFNDLFNSVLQANRSAAPQDQCNPNPCLNGGQCLEADADGARECICTAHWTGPNCQHAVEFGCGGSLPARSRGTFEFPLDGSYSKLIADGRRGQQSSNPSDPNSRSGISSASSASSQSRQIRCIWQLSALIGSALRLEFSRLRATARSSRLVTYTSSASNGSSGAAQLSSSTLFELSHPSNCPERLDIRERLDKELESAGPPSSSVSTGRLLGRFCVLPSTATSWTKSNGTQLRLESESSSVEFEYTIQTRLEPALAFQLAWRYIEPPCGGPVPEADSGAIWSPHFPDFYPAGLECRYLLRVGAGKRIRIRVAELKLLRPIGVDAGNCADSLTILDGALNVDRPVLFRHCANSAPNQPGNESEPIISSSSTVEVVLLSSSSSRQWGPAGPGKQRGGFNLTYEAEPSKPSCSGLYTSRSGRIKSSDFHESVSQSGLSDDDPALAQQFARYFDPREFARDSNSSSIMDSGSGFLLTKVPQVGKQATLRCEYEIRPASLGRNHHVQLDWVRMLTNLPDSSLASLSRRDRYYRCRIGRLLVFSGQPTASKADQDQRLLATLCAGDKYNSSLSELRPLVSSGHVIYLVYEADESLPGLLMPSGGEARGFELSYRTVCSATYQQPSGQIQTELERDIPECIYHLRLPLNNSISLVVEPFIFTASDQMLEVMDQSKQQVANERSFLLPDGSCIAQAVIMDGAVPHSDLGLAQADRQLKTFDFAAAAPTDLDGADGPPDGSIDAATNRVAAAGEPVGPAPLTAEYPVTHTYWQYRSSQAHDIKEFNACNLRGVGINSNWNEMSLMFRLSPKWIEQQQRQPLGQSGEKPRQAKFMIMYQAEMACGGIISEPSRGSINLISSMSSNSSTDGVRVGSGKQTNSTSHCAWILRNPQANQAIQLSFDMIPTAEIDQRRSAWIKWLRSRSSKPNSTARSDSSTLETAMTSVANCSQAFQELIELHEPATGRTRLICPHELLSDFGWTTLSDTVHVRVLNTSAGAANNTWPGRRALAGLAQMRLQYVMSTVSNYSQDSAHTAVCGGTLIQSSGTIKTPRFPFNYPPNLDCVWILQAPRAEQQFRLNFSRFSLEDSNQCQFDHLEIRNGPSSDSPLMNRFCGESLESRLIISQSHVLRLKFHTDTYTSYMGFLLHYDAASTGCGGVHSAESGQIDSPNYPHAYAHSADCEWLIEVSRSKRISLKLHDLNLGSDDDSGCGPSSVEAEYLEVLELSGSGGHSLGRWCHLSQVANGTGKLDTASNRLRVIYRSRAQDRGRGFRLSYVANCTYQHELTGLAGVLESAAGSEGTPCTWVVRAPLGANLSVSVTDLSYGGKFERASRLEHYWERMFQRRNRFAAHCFGTSRAIHLWSGQPANTTASLSERMRPLTRDFVEAFTSMLSNDLRPKYSNTNRSVYEFTQVGAFCPLDTEDGAQEQRSFELTGEANLFVVSQLDADVGFRLEWRAKTSCGSQLQGGSRDEALMIDGIHFDERLNLSQRAIQQPVECLWQLASSDSTTGQLELELSADMRPSDGGDIAQLATVSSNGSLAIRSACNESSLQVFDGPSLSSPIIYENCQAVSKDEALIAASGQALVRFYSAGSGQASKAKPKSSTLGQMGRNFLLYGFPSRYRSCSRSMHNVRSPFRQVAGTRSSLNYPDLYEAKFARCSLMVASERNLGRMRFFIDELDIPLDQRAGSSVQQVSEQAESSSRFAPPAECLKSGSFLAFRDLGSAPSEQSAEFHYCGRYDRKSSAGSDSAAERSVVISEASGTEMEFVTTGISRGRWKVSFDRLCGSTLTLAIAAEELSTPNYPQRPEWAPSSASGRGMSENVCIWRIRSSSWSAVSNPRQSRINFNLLNLIGASDRADGEDGGDAKKRADAAGNSDCLRIYEGYNISLRQAAFNLTQLDTELRAKVRICSMAELKYNSMRYTSQGSELVVVTSGQLIAKFLVHPFEDHCGGEFLLNAAEFASPNFPQPYGPDLDCHYFILGSPGSRVDLRFEQFGVGAEKLERLDRKTGGADKCDASSDYVEIRQLSGATRAQLMLDEYIKLRYREASSSLLLEFLARNRQVVPASEANSTASARRRSLERLIELAHLHWLLVESGDEARYRSRVVGQNSRSALDLEEFYAGSKLIGRFCGQLQPSLAQDLLRDEVLVRLRTSSRGDVPPPVKGDRAKQVTRGFLATYKLQFGGLIRLSSSSDWGLISSPHFPERRKLNSSVVWSFEAPMNERIQFELISLSLGSIHHDCRDSVGIFDELKPSGGSAQLGRICGQLSFKGLLRSRMSPLWAAALEGKVSPRRLPVNSAHDQYVRANLLRRFLSTSNVASVVYENTQSAGAFLMRYKLVRGEQDFSGLNVTGNSSSGRLELELLDRPVNLDEALDEQFEPARALGQGDLEADQTTSMAAAKRSCSKVFQLYPKRVLTPATGGISLNKYFLNDTVQLMSPNWPQEVEERSIECHWLLSTDENTNIVLQVAPSRPTSNWSPSSPARPLWSRYRNNERCSKARSGGRNLVVVHDGASKLAPILAKLCLPAAPLQLESSGRQMFVRYVHEAHSPTQTPATTTTADPTDIGNFDESSPAQDDSAGSGASSLFRAQAHVGRCGGQYHVGYMTIITDRPRGEPRSVPNYENNLDCFYYVFAATTDLRLTISNQLSKLELAPTPSNANCSVGDYIELRDLPISSQHFDYSPQAIQRGSLLGRFCAGRPLPKQLETPNSAISIHFHTDSEATASGFSLMVFVTRGESDLSCPRQPIKLAVDDYFRLNSPGWPHGTGRRALKACRFLISAPPNRSLKLTFVDMRRAATTSSNGSVTCRDSLSYLDDQEAASLRYSQRPLRELVAPLSAIKLRQLVQTIPCTASTRTVKPKELSGSDDDDSDQQLSRPATPLVQRISMETYYEWAGGAESSHLDTSSQHLMLEYSAERLDENEGFVAVVRADYRPKNRACGGEVRAKPGENLLESANFGQLMQESEPHIQCTWRLIHGSSGSSIPNVAPGDQFQVSFLVFSVFEVPPLVQNTTFMKVVYSSYSESDWTELCGLNRLILNEADDDQLSRVVVMCGYATNVGVGWILTSQMDINQVMLRTKNLEQVVYGPWLDSSSKPPGRAEGRRELFRGLRAYFHESSCLSKQRTAYNTIVIRSHAGLTSSPPSSYQPGICHWKLNLDAGHYELVFKSLNLRPPPAGSTPASNSSGQTSAGKNSACFGAGGGHDFMDFLELSLGRESEGEILARFCSANQQDARKHNMVLNATSELDISFSAGLKLLAEDKHEFPVTTSDKPTDKQRATFGFELELVKVKNSSISDFCKRERRSGSIYSFIRNRERSSLYHLHDTVTPGFLYPKNTHCSLDLTIDEDYKFNFTFVSLFDIEPSLNCKNDYVELYDLVARNDSTQTTTARPRPSDSRTNKAPKTTVTTGKPRESSTSKQTKSSTPPPIPTVPRKNSINIFERFTLNLHRELEPKLIGRWCGRDLPKGTFHSMSNRVRVVFHSNEHVEGKGFILEWSASPVAKATELDADLDDD